MARECSRKVGVRIWSGFGCVMLLVVLLCGEGAGFHDGTTDYVSFENTAEWSRQYPQTCRGKGKDDFREPRYTHLPVHLRPSWESKTPISILSKETVRKTGPGSNLTLHIFNNQGKRKAYSVAYGFQKDKECIHGQDAHCIVKRSFGSVRALVLNAERFQGEKNLNFIKDNFLVEEPEEHVTILNGGSPYERKFYEAVFLGGYIPKALQRRGKSSHVIDGKSYPMEIYMYFVDETVPSMSLATILVVLVEESPKDNPHIKPVINAVNNELYNKERRFLQQADALLRREQGFHSLDKSLKYDIFGDHSSQDEPIRQERFKAAVNMDGDLATQLEVFEKMQALESQLMFLDEHIKEARASLARASSILYVFETRKHKHQFFPLEHPELFYIMQQASSYSAFDQRRTIYHVNMVKYDPHFATKPLEEELSEEEFLVKRYNFDTDAKWQGLTMAEGLLQDSVLNIGFKLLYYEVIKNADLLEQKFGVTDARGKAAACKRELMKLAFQVAVHGQRYMNWHKQNRDNSTKMSNEEKYRRINKYQDLLEQREVINKNVFDYFFGPDSLHQLAAKDEADGGWGWNWAVPDFKDTDYPKERPKKTVEGLINFLDQKYKKEDYEKYVKRTEAELLDLAKANNFEDVDTMRKVLHEHKFGYKSFNEWNSRDKVHDAYFARNLPYQQKRKGLKEMGNMEMTDQDNKEEEDAQPVKAIIDQSFQVSWLLPPNGGYYYYAGSSPVPPCYRAQNVIVFKKPIKMSRYQIETLARVPTSFERDWDIEHTTPVLHDHKFKVRLAPPLGSQTRNFRYEEVVVPIYFQPRSHLFLGLDGVQKNAVLEHEKREARKARMAAVASWMSQSWIQTIWIVAVGWAMH